MQVCVVYPLALAQAEVVMELEEGATVDEAIRRSGFLDRYPEIRVADLSLGVWGKMVTNDTLLRDLDRVEIYRPLTADPKEVRRRRAAKKRARS